MSLELTEQEQRQIELQRILGEQDPTMKYLNESLMDVLSILKTRGEGYNGNASGIMEQVYDMGDMSAFIHTSRPVKRMKQILSDNGIFCSDKNILDKIIDTLGYALLWLCCRKRSKSEGLN